MNTVVKELANEEAMVAFGRCVAQAAQGRGVVYLLGDLGAGKTTFSRGVLRGYGYQQAVKSPTYTLVEPYELDQVTLYHFDLYRLGEPEELEYLGVRDYFGDHSLCLVEWPQRGEGFLPTPDLQVTIELSGEGRQIELLPMSDWGEQICQRLTEM